MLANIIDRRSNSYDVRCDAVFEPSQHDNSTEGSTKFTWGSEVFDYDEMLDTSIVQAVERCQLWDCPVTMFLYDPGTV
jgi:hypothetical protein